MVNSELLSYVKQVMDLETSVYTNQCLQEGFSRSMAAQAPMHPEKPKIKTIAEPTHPYQPVKDSTAGEMLGTGIFCLVGGFMFLLIGGFFSSIVGGLVLVVGAFFAVGYPITKKEEQEKEAKYADALKKYNAEMTAYKNERAEAEAWNQEQEQTYQSELAVYDQSMTAFTAECEKSRESIIEAGNHLKNALEQLYGANVIYPKYRNLVAVTMIYEYLASGRCDTLEGADGAYNLYEMELRQNIIIGQLSSVLDSLEQIKNSQFTLYNEIAESNQRSATLLSNISDNVEFNRYASEETAKANAAIAQNTEATKYYTLFNAAKRK